MPQFTLFSFFFEILVYNFNIAHYVYVYKVIAARTLSFNSSLTVNDCSAFRFYSVLKFSDFQRLELKTN